MCGDGGFILTTPGKEGWGCWDPTHPPSPPSRGLRHFPCAGTGWARVGVAGSVGGAGFAPLPRFLEAPAFLVKQMLGLLRKVPGKPHLGEGSRVGLRGFPPPPMAEGKVWVQVWAGMGGLPPGAALQRLVSS